jgi:hypothetical protein
MDDGASRGDDNPISCLRLLLVRFLILESPWVSVTGWRNQGLWDSNRVHHLAVRLEVGTADGLAVVTGYGI